MWGAPLLWALLPLHGAAALYTVPRVRLATSIARHATPVARELAFVANYEAVTEPFPVGAKPIGEWFAEDQAIRILMSQAESSRRVDAGGPRSKVQRWEVTTPIDFPGMVARSETSMDITINSETPLFTVSSGLSKTVCEGGPAWARGLLSRIGEIAETSSNNVVQLRDAPGGLKTCVSTVSLKVSLNIPGLLLPPFVPAGPFERAGSESIQKLLDKDMPVVLRKFKDAYCEWAS